MNAQRQRGKVLRLARLVHPISSKERMMAVLDLIAYMDESGTHGGPTIVVGGYLANATQWESFEAAWKPVIEREGLTAFRGFKL